MFTLEQLEGFVAVADELHFGRAAARLSMTQPPLSRRIKLLEDEVGVRLLDRSHRSVKLTPAGRLFLADARQLLRQSHEAALSARRALSGESGVVAVGFTATTAYSFLERVLVALGRERPQIELVLREMVTAAQLETLMSGALDIGMIRPPAGGADLADVPLYQEPLLAALPAGHRFADRDRPPAIGEFHGEPLVMYSPSEARYFHDVLVSAFRSAGAAPRYVQYLSQVHSILALVKAGLGVALVPAAAASLHYEGVCLRGISGMEPYPVELHLSWHRANDNPALAAVRSVIRREAARVAVAGT
ncbi:LysR family transcriptional regulator [Streptantibioticus silvisoli]|jgi:DNA-binding transcriptional LysR family regulator|uniref:LysR family transcriptional regulator n=1 Tax=Streptantibioticus silvisoli TaxID=2705255 RepID=A0ABT6WB25_9ACTN|nr:LysR family transcriptional regulator [Streptantibioticus silvisoli]MDI5967668.1 LysR family transcriptional regulator [Streptantibioticus silvisoli]